MKNALLGSLLLIIASCSSSRYITSSIEALEEKFDHHSGFLLYDVEKNETVYQHNAEKYFTPASNTKILTFYTCAKILSDSIPGLYYVERNDSTIFWGTGDPSLFYESLPTSNVINFLSEKDSAYFSNSNFYDHHFGEGWAWDDYYYSFSPEKSVLPLYGNLFTVVKEEASDSVNFIPNLFSANTRVTDSSYRGDLERKYRVNDFSLSPSLKKSYKLSAPFITGNSMTIRLLNESLPVHIDSIDMPITSDYQTVYSVPTDSALHEMMVHSDNFIAEQLLLVASSMVSDSVKTKTIIRWAQDSLLNTAPDPFVWIDGSGLSRYNLMTPRSAVWLWQQLLIHYGQEKLFTLIGSGGNPGTLENYYVSRSPYLYAKTGTLSNNFSLSGFLITKSGKLLIFSFMNSNFPSKAAPVKRNVESILNEIYSNY